MKKVLKGIGVSIGVVAALGGGFAAHEWYADKPFMFRSLLDREMVKMAFDSPETLTSLGFLESVGITGHNAELDDDRPEKLDEMFAKGKQISQWLRAYSDNELDASEQLSKEIALYLLDFFG